MKKTPHNILFLLAIFISIPSLADSMVCDASGNCVLVHTTNTTTDTTNQGSTTPTVPVSSPGGGPSAADLAAKAAAEHQGCLDQVALIYTSQCNQQASSIYNKDLAFCNTLVVGGTFLAGLATFILATEGAPEAIALKMLYGGTGVGGLTGAAYGASFCRDTSAANLEFNKQQCSDEISNLQAQFCPSK